MTDAPLVVTYLGVSSGVTSAEFYEKLRGIYKVDFVATDLWRDAVAIRSAHSHWVSVLDAQGAEFQYVLEHISKSAT